MGHRWRCGSTATAPIARTGGPVAVFGHSCGANCAIGGAVLTRSVAQLVLYEPSLGTSYPPGALDAIESSIAAGEPRRRSHGRALADRDVRRRDRGAAGL